MSMSDMSEDDQYLSENDHNATYNGPVRVIIIWIIVFSYKKNLFAKSQNYTYEILDETMQEEDERALLHDEGDLEDGKFLI